MQKPGRSKIRDRYRREFRKTGRKQSPPDPNRTPVRKGQFEFNFGAGAKDKTK